MHDSTEIQQETSLLIEELYVSVYIETIYAELWTLILEGATPFFRSEVPFIGDIVERVFNEAYGELLVDLIDEAIERKDHSEIYGLSEKEFRHLAYHHELNDNALIPSQDFPFFEQAVQNYLRNHNMFFEDYHNRLTNQPVVEVW